MAEQNKADDQQAQESNVHEFTLFAEAYQFYLQDENIDEDISIYWDPMSRDNLLAVGDRIVGIGTVRELEVPVSVELIAREPKDEEFDDWDHVTECSIDLPSGKLLVTGATEHLYEAQKIEVVPGTYVARIYYGLLDDVDAEGFEGEDFYRIVLWPDNPRLPSVLKQWVPAGRQFPEDDDE